VLSPQAAGLACPNYAAGGPSRQQLAGPTIMRPRLQTAAKAERLAVEARKVPPKPHLPDRPAVRVGCVQITRSSICGRRNVCPANPSSARRSTAPKRTALERFLSDRRIEIDSNTVGRVNPAANHHSRPSGGQAASAPRAGPLAMDKDAGSPRLECLAPGASLEIARLTAACADLVNQVT
jgi:hypothetical protein